MGYLIKDEKQFAHGLIYPASAKFNGSDQLINFGQDALWNNLGVSDFFLAFKFNSIAAGTLGGCSRAGSYPKFVIAWSGTTLKYEFRWHTDVPSTGAITTTCRTGINNIAIMNVNRDGNMDCYLNGALIGSADISAGVAENVTFQNDMRLGAYGATLNANPTTVKLNGSIIWAKFGKNLLTTNEIADIETYVSSWACYPVGNPVKEYDIYGTKNGTWIGASANRISYKLNGNLMYKDYGFSRYNNAGSIEYLPYISGSARPDGEKSLGYEKIYDSDGNTTSINMFSGAIDFNPEKKTDTELDLFNKANDTIHIATVGMDYYDAEFPYMWTIEELTSYTKYNSYFTEAYQDRLFTKVDDNLLKEILNCKAKQTGAALTKVKAYCGIV